MNVIHQAFQKAWDKTQEVGRQSITWIKQKKDQAGDSLQHVWDDQIKQKFWQNTIKTKLIEQKIKPLGQKTKDHFYTGNEEYWDWKNIAILTSGVAIPVILTIGAIALFGAPYAAIFGLIGFGVFLGACGISQHRLHKTFDDNMWQIFEDLRTAINQTTRANSNFAQIETHLKLLNHKDNFKLSHRATEIDDLQKEIEKLKELTTNANVTDPQFKDAKTKLLQKIEDLQKKLSKIKVPAVLQAVA